LHKSLTIHQNFGLGTFARAWRTEKNNVHYLNRPRNAAIRADP
jgi:hypothetical protein